MNEKTQKRFEIEKKKVYVVTLWLKDQDDEGEPLSWTSPSEERFADTYEQAQQMKEKILSGQDEYYGDLVEDCWISDEMEEREFYVPVNKQNEKQAEKQRLFVDMDGTLAVFKPVDEMETLYEEGYFLNLTPQENVVEAIREIVAEHPEIEVNILSAYLTDSRYALQEKNEWLDRHLPEIDRDHRVFVPCGTDKKEGIREGIRSNDFLLDDYTKNLNEWQPPARGIKLLNGINHTRGSWPHDRLRHDRESKTLASCIVSIMRNERQILDEKVHSVQNRKDEGLNASKDGRTSVLGNLYGKQRQLSEEKHKKGEIKKEGEKGWEI